MTKSSPATEVEFLAALGGALNDWQLVETALCGLFETVMRSPDPRVASEVFYAVQNFRDKLAMVDAAVRFTFWQNETRQSAWRKLADRLDKRSKRRNAIVHAHRWEDSKTGPRLGPQYTLTRSVKIEADPQSPILIDTKQLIESARSFRDLAISIREYHEQVRAWLTPRR